MTRAALERDEIERRMVLRPEWSLNEDATAITRSYKFADFVEAFGFISQCALHAEKANHHPEWSNVYSKVDVRLTTHSAKGLTDLDFSMAAFMDRVAGR